MTDKPSTDSRPPLIGPHVRQLNAFQCQKCKHEWVPRVAGTVPNLCPHCKAVKYWLPKVKGVGRPTNEARAAKLAAAKEDDINFDTSE